VQAPQRDQGSPRAKRPRLQTGADKYCPEEDSSSEAEFDPESYYQIGEKDNTHEEVKRFTNTTLVKCLPKRKRMEIARRFPMPDLMVHLQTRI